MDQAAAAELASALNRRYMDTDPEEMLRDLIDGEFHGRVACLSSFGAESAVLLALVARVNPDTPVIFIDTGKLFPETLSYREELSNTLGLTDLRPVGPTAEDVAEKDPEGILWYWDPDRCCAFRKVEPLERALQGFDLVISGRKRYHGAVRKFLPRFQAVNGQIKVDPIAHWEREKVESLFEDWALPRHPLVAQGYPSIGCAPCTAPADASGDVRAGRWAGRVKTECGIHVPVALAS